jgi:tetratricopeptide (TPR) repeat protein
MSLAATVAAAVAMAAGTSVHLPVSTNVAQAQALVDRGLFFYYAFDRGDAAASFAQASASDPHLAMAYWGVALAEGPDLNTPLTEERFDAAARAIGRAVALDAALPLREQNFIAAMALRYRGTFANWTTDDAAYRNAMLAFAQSSKDENAELLAAEALFESGGLAWQGGTLASSESRQALALVTEVLGSDPASVMANHLCIHAHDLAPDRAPALPCAQRLDATSFPPQAEHLAHMPAHYWIETGDYAAALASSERAYRLLSQLETSATSSAHVAQYAKHDVIVGYSAAMMLGNYAVAKKWAQRMDGVFETKFDALTALRFGHYAQAYASAADQFGGLSVRGLAALQLNRLREAHALAANLHATLGDPSKGYLPELFLARLAEADGNYDQAQRWIEQSIDNERADFSGEMIPLFPAGEALGGLFLRRGSDAQAASAFRATLAAYPNDPRALFGLATALAQDGESTQAAEVRSRFDAVWAGADTTPESDELLP